ncbi:Protein SPA chloroplastic [Bienertia sinuspersici]
MYCSLYNQPSIWIEPMKKISALRRPRNVAVLNFVSQRFNFKVQASSMMGSSSDNSSKFADRIEQAWLISQQPTPIACSSCSSNGRVECKWCAGTGFFIIGDNMLCEVPSRNTTCVICAGEGSTQCGNCQGTGFRAKWLGKPPIYK